MIFLRDQVINYIHETTFSILSALNKGESPEIRIKMHPNPDKKTRSIQHHRRIGLATSKMARKLGQLNIQRTKYLLSNV